MAVQLASGMRPTPSIVPLYPPSMFEHAPYLAQQIAKSVAAGTFESDKLYWNRYAKLITSVKDLPTEDMLRRALPEGVLRPGGTVRGFVYFPGVDDDIERVTLRGDFLNAATGGRVVTLAIPFEIG